MNEKNNDKQISEFLKSNLPRERRDEWFVRKTMNRLPDRRGHIFSGWEVVSYIISFLVLTTLLVWQLYSLYFDPIVQVSDYIGLCLISVGYVFLLFSVVMPVVRRG